MPFHAYLPYTQVHIPPIPDPEFAQKTRRGNWADLLTQLDAFTGQILGALDRLGLAEDRIVVWSSDNGADPTPYNMSPRSSGHMTSFPSRTTGSTITAGETPVSGHPSPGPEPASPRAMFPGRRTRVCPSRSWCRAACAVDAGPAHARSGGGHGPDQQARPR